MPAILMTAIYLPKSSAATAKFAVFKMSWTASRQATKSGNAVYWAG